MWHVLEWPFTLVLANAMHIRNVPGRAAQLVEALHGRVTAHHRVLIELHLTQIEALETAVKKLERHVGTRSPPFVPPSTS